jgi:lysophospholipase L1-like esterase
VSCELRLSRAAVAVIMLGPNDVYNLSLDQYDQSLRQMVDGAIQHGTIPVLTTFAWCGGGELGDKALQLNSITANIAQEYDIPLINFWAAAQALPNCGLPDGIHLSAGGPPYGAYFTGDETQAGFTLRNLVTLQTLDALRQAALY